MDGNARWARRRRLPIAAGHRAGTRALRRTVEAAIDLGVESLAVYAFSTENWSRPANEVELLMEIFGETIERELPDLVRQGVRVRFIGRRDRAPDELHETDGCTRGGDEAQRAAQPLDRLRLRRPGRARPRRRAGWSNRAIAPHDIDENAFAAQLYAPELPDPDLLIRTSGRAADLELPALAARLLGARLRRHALARLRPRSSSARRWPPTRSRRRRFGGR